MVGVGIVGCGYWGPNVIRNFSALEKSEILTICDLNPAPLAGLQRRYPSVRCTTDFRHILEDPKIDAVAICTPVDSHYELANAALSAGKHVMVEKPLTHSAETAEMLVALAETKGLTLQVDHTFIYSGAVQKLRSIIDSGEIGDVLYIDCVRINLGLFQPDVNVLWGHTHNLAVA